MINAQLLCSQDEAIRIYQRYSSHDEDSAALGWAQRLLKLIVEPGIARDNEALPDKATLTEDFLLIVQKLEDFCERPGEWTNVKGTIQLFVADVYASGQVAPRDAEKARRLWEIVVDNGASDESLYEGATLTATVAQTRQRCLAAWSLSQCYLGTLFAPKGPLFERDVPKALFYLEIAKGIKPQAAFDLGQRYYAPILDTSPAAIEAHVEKHGVAPDDKRAAENFHLAASMSHVRAKIALAEMILSGRAHRPDMQAVDEASPTPADVRYVSELLRPHYKFKTQKWRIPGVLISAKSPIRQIILPEFQKEAKKEPRRTQVEGKGVQVGSKEVHTM